MGQKDIKIWTSVQGTEGQFSWIATAALKYMDQRVKQMVGGIRLRLTNTMTTKANNYLAVVHENGWVSFWSTVSWQLAYTFKLNNQPKKVVFESSCRYLASLSVDGHVEVWRIKGEEAKYKWGL